MWSWIKRKLQPSTRELLFKIIPKVELVPVTVPEKYVIPKSFKPPEPKTLTKARLATKKEDEAKEAAEKKPVKPPSKKKSGKASPEAKAMTGKYEANLNALEEEKASNIIKNA